MLLWRLLCHYLLKLVISFSKRVLHQKKVSQNLSGTKNGTKLFLGVETQFLLHLQCNKLVTNIAGSMPDLCSRISSNSVQNAQDLLPAINVKMLAIGENMKLPMKKPLVVPGESIKTPGI